MASTIHGDNEIDVLAAKLLAIQSDDPESAHREADELLLKYIGSQKVRDAFEAVSKWYA